MHCPADPLETAAAWRDDGLGVAIATVMTTWGSSPRPPGSQLVVNSRGEFAGSVSAGCVEATVVTVAQQVLASGKTQVLELGIENGMAWEVGLSCGGQISILITPLALGSGWLDEWLRVRSAYEPRVVVTHLGTGRQELLGGGLHGLSRPQSPIEVIAKRACDEGRCLRETTHEGDFFFHPFLREPRLLIVGAVHIAEPLLVLARLCDLECIVIDPREAFAKREAFADANVVCRWPDQALDALGVDSSTAVVTLTHDPKIDDPALQRALSQGAFYVGALGSQKTQKKRRERLRESGLSQEAVDKLKGPVGLAIGALSPAEIAVSILAEMIATRRT